jgi:hypothetical protein
MVHITNKGNVLNKIKKKIDMWNPSNNSQLTHFRYKFLIISAFVIQINTYYYIDK